MDDLIYRTQQGYIYFCDDCPYRNREANFCGFCMLKILDEMANKNIEMEESGDVSAKKRKS